MTMCKEQLERYMLSNISSILVEVTIFEKVKATKRCFEENNFKLPNSYYRIDILHYFSFQDRNACEVRVSVWSIGLQFQLTAYSFSYSLLFTPDFLWPLDLRLDVRSLTGK